MAGMGKRGMEGGPPGVEGKDEEAPKRRRGRPVGSKDRKPRVKRIVATPKATSKTSDEGTGVRKKPWKIILSADEAVEIYQKRPLGDTSAFTCSCRSKELSEQYVVNSKTIRDIWNRITWVKATHKYWTEEEELDYIQGQQAVAQVRMRIPSLSVPHAIRHLLHAPRALSLFAALFALPLAQWSFLLLQPICFFLLLQPICSFLLLQPIWEQVSEFSFPLPPAATRRRVAGHREQNGVTVAACRGL